MSISREELATFLDDLLQPSAYQDYGPNGLQIEGKARIERIAYAVSATRDSVARAIEGAADALIVHHGLFWKFHGPRPITGTFGRRVMPLVRNELSLFGYHLPLDGHLEIGNAACIARRLELLEIAPFGDHEGMPIGARGVFRETPTAAGLRDRLAGILGHPVILSTPDEGAAVRSLGIITGGANSEWRQAVALGLDAYLTGEISEHDWNDAQEAGIHMYAGGHHATEVFGIQALQARVEERFAVAGFFIESANPA